MEMSQRSSLACTFAVSALALVLMPGVLFASPFISGFSKFSLISSTVPSNRDVNPYGVAVIPTTVGSLHKDNILVSNFNNKSNLQGTGTTIVQISPKGSLSLFAQIDPDKLHGACPGGVGLTTALGVLTQGWVIVGSLPTTDGMADTAKAGCLIILDSDGDTVGTIAGHGINGPWDMATVQHADDVTLFVTNVLNGNVTEGDPHVVNQATVLRVDLEISGGRDDDGHAMPMVQSIVEIGSGFSEMANPTALIIGPTGVGLGHDGKLYVADTLNNRIAAIPDAMSRSTTAFAGEDVSSNLSLNGPLGLTIAPNGDILTVNGNDGNLVETSPSGTQVATATLIMNGGGDLFGLAVAPGGTGIYVVNDGDNTLDLFH
jgi:hypothetical protein